MEEIKSCEQCGHPSDPHLVVATGESPTEGGVLLCQVKGCDCYATWSIPQLGSTRESIRIPGDTELTALRNQLQTEPEER